MVAVFVNLLHDQQWTATPQRPNIMPEFSIQAPCEPKGDQPTAIVGEASSLVNRNFQVEGA